MQYGGGREGVSRVENILGAIGRPYHGYHRPVARKAAALFHGVATSHGFIDANKRTAWLLTLLLIERSGYSLMTRDQDKLDEIAVAVVDKVMSELDLEAWIKARLVQH